MLLDQYVDLLETNLPAIVEADKKRIWENAAKEDDSDGVASDVARHLEMLLEDGITTRFLASSAFVAIWASYEAAVRRFAQYLATKKGATDMPRRNGTFVARARKYFSNVLGVPLHDAAADWDRLEELAKIRHAIAHANGRLEDIENAHDVALLKRLAASGRGIALVDEYLVLTVPFLRDSFTFLEALVVELQRRVEAIA